MCTPLVVRALVRLDLNPHLESRMNCRECISYFEQYLSHWLPPLQGVQLQGCVVDRDAVDECAVLTEQLQLFIRMENSHFALK